MTEEEKKAIGSFKQENENDLSRFEDFNDYTQTLIKRNKTILNLIQKQQKEISELKAKYDKDTHTLQNQLDVANADLYECNKIINEMTKHIEDNDITETFCCDKISCDEDCQKCIKQYFEKKVREEND